MSGYNRLSVSSAYLKYKIESEKSETYHGFDLGWDHGWNISNAIPLFIEAGVHGQMNVYDDDFHVDVTMPITATYRFYLSDNISIAPLAGFFYRVNIYEDIEEEYLNRCQFGGQYGFNFNLSRFVIGLSYRQDWSNIADNGKISLKTGTLLWGVGFNF